MNIREQEIRQGMKQGNGRKTGQMRYKIIFGAIAVLIVILNIAAWNSEAFSDWYIAYIFPVWVSTYGRLTGLFPFSVGEWLLAAGVVLAALALVLGIIWVSIGIVSGVRGVVRRGRLKNANAPGETDASGDGNEIKKRIFCGFQGFSRRFCLFFAWTLLIVSLVMTLNCFILYHASAFSEHYFGADESEYTLEELIQVYNMVAGQCNQLAKEMERDENGMVIYSGSVRVDGVSLDMADMARELMRQLGETYSQLDGYYPRPKALMSSDFMCQQYMQGYYFPFSMEANYNDVMHILNIPSTMCHELAHLRGYIYEDEANFIGYLACVQSEDAFFQYAGYLSVLNYLNNDLQYAWENSRNAYEKAAALVRPVAVDAQVWTDNIFVVQEEWDRINGKALIDTEIVDAAADVFIDTNQKVNGIADGAVSYSRVVKLLLQYYKQSGGIPAE